MRLSEMLAQSRVAFVEGTGLAKPDAIAKVAHLLATGCDVPEDVLAKVLREREELQSTGIGDGVAIPHASIADLTKPVAALLLVRDGLEFGAIDRAKVHHVFAVVGPKREAGEHLRTLARISKLLRNAELRAKLLSAEGPAAALDLVASEEEARP
jgi:PTS system nitrogen regulatory IIA component